MRVAPDTGAQTTKATRAGASVQKPRGPGGSGEWPPGGAAAGRQLRMSFLPGEGVFGLLARLLSRPAAGVTVFWRGGEGRGAGAVPAKIGAASSR